MMGSHLRIAVVLALAAVSSARADLPFIIPYHVLLNSDVVFSGVLTDTKLHIAGNHEYNSGIVRVVKVFAGRVVPMQQIEITWVNETGVICPRVSYDALRGKEALWFFKETWGRHYDANDAQRVMLLSQDVLETFLEYFLKRHGPADTDIERAIDAYVRQRLQTLPAR